MSYKDVFINRIYSIEDLDRLWQLEDYKLVADAWSQVNAKRESS